MEGPKTEDIFLEALGNKASPPDLTLQPLPISTTSLNFDGEASSPALGTALLSRQRSQNRGGTAKKHHARRSSRSVSFDPATPIYDDQHPYPLAGPSRRDPFPHLNSSTSSLGRRNSSPRLQITPVEEQRYPMTESLKTRLSASQHGSEDVQRHVAEGSQRTLEPMTLDESPPVNSEGESTTDYVTGLRLILLMAGLMLAMFIFAIDRTIISPVGVEKNESGLNHQNH